MIRPASLGIAVLLLAGSGLRPAAAQERGVLEVVEITFEGNERIDASQLEQAILTEETRCESFLFIFPLPLCPFTNLGFAHERRYLEPGELPNDRLRLELYYRQRGYRQATIDTSVVRGDGEVRIAFLIDEGRPTVIASLEVTGADTLLRPERRRDLLGIGEGDPLDLAALERGEDRLIDELQGRGYVKATVLHDYFIPRGSLEAEVGLRIAPGPRVRVGEIQVEGAEAIGEEVIRALLSFQSGDIFRSDEIIESQRRLYNLAALRYASITSEARADTDTLIDLHIQVDPAPQRTIALGLGMETDECGQVQAQLTNRNFLGRGRVLRLTSRLSNLFARQLQGSFPCTDVSQNPVFQTVNYRVEAAFEQPVFSGGRNSLRASIYAEEETVPDLFVRSSTGGELSLTHRVAPRTIVTAAFRPQLTAFGEQSADVYFCVNFGFCTPEDISVLSDRRWLSPLGLLFALDRTDDPFSATRGYYVTLESEYAGGVTGSDYRYFRSTIDAAAFAPLGGARVLAGHIRFGWIDPSQTRAFATASGERAVVHPLKRFFAGGASSVRGFGANLLGPTVLVVDAEEDCPGVDLETCVAGLEPGEFDQRPVGGNAVIEGSLELRAELGGRWTIVGFVDAGQVWTSLGDRSSIVVTPGVGFRFRSPIGPLRVDLGYDTSSASEKPVVALFEGGDIQALNRTVLYDPYSHDNPGIATEVLRRLQLQFSIGEAF